MRERRVWTYDECGRERRGAQVVGAVVFAFEGAREGDDLHIDCRQAGVVSRLLGKLDHYTHHPDGPKKNEKNFAICVAA